MALASCPVGRWYTSARGTKLAHSPPPDHLSFPDPKRILSPPLTVTPSCSVVKIWVCKHVRKGLARPVNKSGECQVCRNATLKTRAGIKVKDTTVRSTAIHGDGDTPVLAGLARSFAGLFSFPASPGLLLCAFSRGASNVMLTTGANCLFTQTPAFSGHVVLA